jgi:hypothetical protein
MIPYQINTFETSGLSLKERALREMNFWEGLDYPQSDITIVNSEKGIIRLS